MSTYCSIQEAYNEPSFSKPRKTNPNKMQCGGQNGGPTPNNLYTNQRGQEQAAAYRQTPMQSMQSSPSPSQPQPMHPNTPAKRMQKQVQMPQMVENFMCGGPAAAIPSGSTGAMSMKNDPVTGNMPYSAQGNDYKYYCDNMGICPTPDISFEGFANYSELASTPSQNGIPQNWQPYQTPAQMPEQSSTYVYPISDETKQQYDAAMKVYLNNGQTSTPGTSASASSQSSKSSQSSQSATTMENISGLYDDEISQYMRIQDMGLPYANSASAIYDNNPYSSCQQVPKPPETSTPLPFDNNRTLTNKPQVISNAMTSKPQEMPQAQALAPQSPLAPLVQSSQAPQKQPANKWQYIMDAVLFIAAGVLIIILCDLLFKIAYSIGMRDSFTMMHPYLSEIEELKAKIAEMFPEDLE